METRLNRPWPDRLKKNFVTETNLPPRRVYRNRFNRSDCLTKHYATETILTLEASVWKPSLMVQIACQNFCDRDNAYVRDDYMEARIYLKVHLRST